MSKELKIKNTDLVPTINFITELHLKKAPARGGSKLVKLLEEKLKDFNEDAKQLRDPYVKKDGDEPVVKNNLFVFKTEEDKKECDKEFQALSEEEAIITLNEFSNKIEAFYKALEDSEESFTGKNMLILDMLLDQFEVLYAKANKEDK